MRLHGTLKHYFSLGVLRVSVVFNRSVSDIVKRGIRTPQIEIDMAVDPEKDKAIAQRLASLPYSPQCIAHLLAERSKRKAVMKSWTSALTDAKWVIFLSHLR